MPKAPTRPTRVELTLLKLPTGRQSERTLRLPRTISRWILKVACTSLSIKIRNLGGALHLHPMCTLQYMKKKVRNGPEMRTTETITRVLDMVLGVRKNSEMFGAGDDNRTGFILVFERFLFRYPPLAIFFYFFFEWSHEGGLLGIYVSMELNMHCNGVSGLLGDHIYT